ncbi:hypothetical protein CLAIMM_03957 [Cladophialophora immunda]|nr:hypothetical protein CLAIMM_03957 [Cladophialophora immunda]
MSQSPLSPQPERLPDNEIPPHQEAMVEACKAGRLADLQKLFDDAPKTTELLVVAISHGQQSIVQYLHSVYPKFDFHNGYIVEALTEKLDIEMFRLICSYAPKVVDFMFDDHQTTVLSKACEGGPQCVPLINFLLDHGATTGGFGSLTYHLGEELLPAVQNEQPVEIIERLVPMTSYLWLPIQAATQRKRADALQVLLNAHYTRGENPSDSSYAQSVLREAKATEDKKTIAVAEHYFRKWEKRARKFTTSDLQPKTPEPRKWWRRGSPTNNKEKSDPEDSGTSNPGDGSAKSWWPLSILQDSPKPAGSHQKEKGLQDSGSDEDSWSYMFLTARKT